MFWLLLVSACLVYGETTNTVGEINSIPKPTTGCTIYNCKGGKEGSIVYGAEIVNHVCTCKLTSWEEISKTAQLVEELSQKVIALSERLEDVENRCLVGLTIKSRLAK